MRPVDLRVFLCQLTANSQRLLRFLARLFQPSLLAIKLPQIVKRRGYQIVVPGIFLCQLTANLQSLRIFLTRLLHSSQRSIKNPQIVKRTRQLGILCILPRPFQTPAVRAPCFLEAIQLLVEAGISEIGFKTIRCCVDRLQIGVVGFIKTELKSEQLGFGSQSWMASAISFSPFITD